MEDAFKACSRCGAVLPRTEFKAHRRADRGVNPRDPEGLYRASECPRCLGLRKRAEKYGISAEQIEALLHEQEDRCAICGERFVAGSRHTTFHVDHDHETGAVRALLCGGCNTGLGGFRDNPESLRTAADYLERRAA